MLGLAYAMGGRIRKWGRIIRRSEHNITFIKIRIQLSECPYDNYNIGRCMITGRSNSKAKSCWEVGGGGGDSIPLAYTRTFTDGIFRILKCAHLSRKKGQFVKVGRPPPPVSTSILTTSPL